MKEDYLRIDGSLKNEASYTDKVAHIKSRIISVHGHKFGLDELEYTGAGDKVKIWCNTHQGYFYTEVYSLYDGHGCGICYFNSKVFNTDQFITKASYVHGNKYNYSEVQYLTTNTPVSIFCNNCKSYFMQTPHQHLSGSNCQVCSGRLYKFLYFLKSLDNPDLYKIGVSNNPIQRIKTVSRELNQSWETLGIFHFDGNSAYKPEQEVHFVLATYKYRGGLVPKGDGYTEVFRLPKLVAKEVFKIIATRGGILLDG